MVKKIPDSILNSSFDIIHRDIKRNEKFDDSDELFYNTQQAPPELADKPWFRLVPTTAPSDAVWGAVRTLSSIEPALSYAPIGLKSLDKENADKIERVLTALHRQAERRSKSKYTRQIILNAVMYDMVAIQLDFIPFMLKDEDISAKLKKRLESTLRYGPFAIHVRNSKNVHAVHSEWGLEEVVFEQVMPAREAVNFFKNGKLEKVVKESETEWVYILDRTNEEMRYVSASILSGGMTAIPTDLAGSDQIPLINKPHELDFVPWIIKGGGSTTETAPEKHFRPLLDSVINSKQAKTVTLLRSLLISDIIYNYYTPSSVSKTLAGETPDIEQDGPRGDVPLRTGEDFGLLPPNIMDVGMTSLLQMVEDDMQRSTAPRILFGEVPSDISFATYNAGIQTASRTIIPFKELGEDALSEMFVQQLMWAKHAEIDLTAFVGIRNAKGGVDRELFTIKWDEFDLNTVDIQVELKADLPVDRQARINAAAMAYRELGVSAAWALDQVGIPDTTLIMEQREQEDFDKLAVQNTMQEMSREFQDAMMQQARERVLQEFAEQQKQEQANVAQPRPDGAARQTQGA